MIGMYVKYRLDFMKSIKRLLYTRIARIVYEGMNTK